MLSPALEICSLKYTALLNTLIEYTPWKICCKHFYEKYTMSAVPHKRTVHKSGEISNHKFSAGQK
jgi:hypothetical protein